MKKLFFFGAALLLVGAGCLSQSDESELDYYLDDTYDYEEDEFADDFDYGQYDGIVSVFSCDVNSDFCEDTSAWIDDEGFTEILVVYDWLEVVAFCDDDDICYAIDENGDEWSVLLLE